jgi:formylglycine-generating enzyme required for sulfatase activity
VFLPNENEWYKAAYYNPATNSFFLYPTSSNTAPTAEAPPGGSNSANYYYPFRAGNLTDVGAYTGTTSPVGAFDMGGNVIQWNETLIGSSSRGVRSGAFSSFGSGDLLSSTRTAGPPQDGFDSAGFRVASIPKPSTELMAMMSAMLICLSRKKYKGQSTRQQSR